MQWIDNKLVDEKNKFLVGYNEGGPIHENDDSYGWARVIVYDANNNDITNDDLSNWEFTEFPELNSGGEQAYFNIPIINKKLNVIGGVFLDCYNNGSSDACFWTEKME